MSFYKLRVLSNPTQTRLLQDKSYFTIRSQIQNEAKHDIEQSGVRAASNSHF